MMMDFDDAIDAHTKWKTRLRLFINGSGEKMESGQICKDDACALGKWIHGEALRHKNSPSYTALEREHANFHLCAAEIVKKVEDGDLEGAETLLDTGPFARASNNTVIAIRRMKQEVAGS
jgi:hypothetical protein